MHAGCWASRRPAPARGFRGHDRADRGARRRLGTGAVSSGDNDSAEPDVASWLNRFEHVCGRKARLTKKERNTTAHGARHSYCQRKFSEIAGKPAPIQGGGDYTPELLEQALRAVVEAAGHSRIAKSQAYLGAVRAARRQPRAGAFGRGVPMRGLRGRQGASR